MEEIVWPDIPKYSPGDTAVADLYTPVQLVVLDVERTETEREERLGQLAPIYSYHPSTKEKVESKLTTAFLRARDEFLKQLESTFGHSKLDSMELSSSKFALFQKKFKPTESTFVITPSLAKTWGSGDSGNRVLMRYKFAIAETIANHYIIDDTELSERLASSPRILMVTPLHSEQKLSTLELDSGEYMSKADLIPLSQTKTTITDKFAQEGWQFKEFISSLVEPTLHFEETLTHQQHAEEVADLWNAMRYDPGQIIVAKGELVSLQAIAAIEHLIKLKPVILTITQPAPIPAGPFSEAIDPKWFWSAVAATILLSIFLVFSMMRRHMVHPAGSQLALSEEPLNPNGDLRERLLPHLARQLKEKLVVGLVSQRRQMLSNESAATAQVQELEARLANLHPKIQEKIHAYEQQIEELQRDLKDKEEETREIIRAKLVLAREERDAELTRHLPDWR